MVSIVILSKMCYIVYVVFVTMLSPTVLLTLNVFIVYAYTIGILMCNAYNVFNPLHIYSFSKNQSHMSFRSFIVLR